MEPLGDLLERCRRGEPLAFEDVVARFSGSVYKLCYHMLGNRHDAEDVVQEAFLIAFVEIAKLSDVRAFGRWLSRIAARLCLGRLQRPRWVEWLDHLGGSKRDAGLETVETRDALQKALSQLSPTIRAVVLMRDVLDHSYTEIAEILQVPEGTVKSRLNAGRTQLRRLLGGPAEEAQPCPNLT